MASLAADTGLEVIVSLDALRREADRSALNMMICYCSCQFLLLLLIIITVRKHKHTNEPVVKVSKGKNVLGQMP
eukprot:scaffold2591_cov54-Skeletonema_dohrnii-CCMP3373.AAC.1